MSPPGKIYVFTGEGKGKTTAALGLALQAVAKGMKVFMVQFLKAPDSSGEHFAARALTPELVIKPMGRKGLIGKRGGIPEDAAMAREALQEARSAICSGSYGLVILDEVNVAARMGLVSVQEVLDLMASIPPDVVAVLTGRYADAEVIRRADLVVEMRKIKHHFDRGIRARKGIEF